MIKNQALSGLKVKGNIYWAMVLRLVVILLLFTLCRIGFYVFNASYFPEMTTGTLVKILYGGLRFDLTAILYINALNILLTIVPVDLRFNRVYQLVLKYLFFLLNGIAIAANVADFVYYRFTLRRTTADIFDEFNEGPGAPGLLFRFLIDYWYASLLLFALLWLMVKLYNWIKIEGPMLKSRAAYYIFGILSIPLIAYLFIGAVRGGFRHSTRPITLSNAGEFVTHSNQTSIVLNTPFSIFRTIGKNKVKKVNYYTNQDELNSVFNPIHIPSDTVSFRPMNVVVILLESFSKEFFGVFNKDKKNYKGYTPFLDSLIQHSKTYQYSFSSGRKSIDAPPSALASIPTFNVPFVLTSFANNKFNSLASLLGEKGYHSSFFIGHPNGAMGYTSFTQLAGFQHYYGLDEYGNSDDFDGLWGIWDHKFFPYHARMLNEFPEPFISVLFSVSSHHPFVVPEEFKGRFEGGKQPILKCIEYTDYALREYFKQISSEPWYTNTLFVLTADHCSSDIIFDESRATPGLFSVPIIFFTPDNSLNGLETEIIQQADIMPSILGYLHFDKPFVAFGRDVFREKTTPMAFNFRDTYNLFMNDYLLNFNGEQTVGLFRFKEDRLLTNDVSGSEKAVVSEMEGKIKAIIQQYNNRMIENNLTVNE